MDAVHERNAKPVNFLKERFEALGRTPRQLIGASIARILVGLAGLHFYVSGFSPRDFLWGGNGYFADSDFPSGNWLTVFIVLAMLVALLFILYGGRILGLVHGFLILTFYHRNPILLDGGDNYISIVVWFLPFVFSNTYLALGTAKRRRRLEGSASADFRLTYALHNLALFLMGFQVAIIYVVAGLSKVASPVWRSGEAIYFISRMREFQYSGLLTSLSANPFVTTAMSYFAVVVQVAFVPLVLNRQTRVFGVLGVAAMHLGIMFGMGLMGFGLSVLSGLAVIVPDEKYLWVKRAFESKFEGFRSRVVRVEETTPSR